MKIRRTIEKRLLQMASSFPAVTLMGPRQSGKTTLCRMVFPDKPYVSFEALDHRARAIRDPRGLLAEYPNGAIFDEVQRAPDLLSYLQDVIDEAPEPGRWILTGSANLLLLDSVSQSLAGRTALLTLLPLSLEELLRFDGAPPETLDRVLLGGSYPAVYDRGLPFSDWYDAYVTTYVERDVRAILKVGDLLAFQTFLELCAGRTAQLLNLSSLGSDCGITHSTAKAWLSVLEASYLAVRLPPWSSNVNKRLVRTPKLHLLDTGMVCHLLGIRTVEQLRLHPLRGSIFESWVVSEVLKARAHRGLPYSASFFRDRKGQEVDLLVGRGDPLVAVEVRAGQTVASDFFRGFGVLRSLAERDPLVARVESVVVYGGEAAQKWSQADVLPWAAIHEYEWARGG